jgi:hypothetical protein
MVGKPIDRSIEKYHGTEEDCIENVSVQVLWMILNSDFEKYISV